jgi:hypothetical protein
VIPKLEIHDKANKLPKIIGIAAIVTILAAGVGLFQTSFAKSLRSNLQSNNLLDLISQLGGTTDQMLANTNRLHLQVQQVEGKLGQLKQQEQILQKQTQTGHSLQQQLLTQEQLTLNGVNLMGQILNKEQQSVVITKKLANQTQQLAYGVDQSARQLGQLVPYLGTSLDRSNQLNGQLDQLLNELSKSQDSFKLFGTLNQVITNPLDVQNSLSKIEDSTLPSTVKDILKGLLP